MAKIVCPYCFRDFNRSDVMFRCNNDNCENIKDDSLSEFWGQERKIQPAFSNNLGTFARLLDKMPNSATCPSCNRESYSVICPHCHNRIPKPMVEKKGYIISIIGARSSGKTNYITVLIDQLMMHGEKLGELGIMASGISDDSKDNTQNRYANDFYNVLFKRKELPPQTQVGDKKSKVPLIYTIHNKNVPPLYLVFYDTAGENFNERKNIENNVRFLDESDAVIFLFDTFAIPYVHEKLNLKQDIELEYDVILANIIEHFTDGNKEKAAKHFKKPMALAFSKIDAILQNADAFADTSIPGMSLDQNSPYLQGNGVSMSDIDGMSDGIRTALKLWKQGNFINNVEANYKNLKYFGFSALGSAPNDDGTVTSINPYRVLDPLVWILDQFKYPLLKQK